MCRGIGGASSSLPSSLALLMFFGVDDAVLSKSGAVLRPRTDLVDLKELVLPIEYRGCITAATEGLGLCEFTVGSDGLLCIDAASFDFLVWSSSVGKVCER